MKMKNKKKKKEEIEEGEKEWGTWRKRENGKEGVSFNLGVKLRPTCTVSILFPHRWP